MMNAVINGDGGGGAAAATATSAKGTVSKRVPGMPLISGRNKDRDHEDLILFQELHKRQKERNILSLLQPVSDEFEPTGNYQLYRTAAAQKGSGFEFLAENDKNDYDWLKTPPVTPLFPSLEMETNGPELVIQREIPILHPLSRFAGGNCNSEAVERRNGHGRPKQKIPVMIPSQRRSSSSSTVSSNVNAQTKNSSKARARAVPAVVNHHLNQKAAVESDGDLTRLKRSANNNNMVNESYKANNIDQKDGSRSSTIGADYVSSSRAMEQGVKMVYSKAKPTTASSTSTRRGGVSIVSSSTQIAAGFCDEKPPPNLRTEQRSTSASTTQGRGRASAWTHQIQKAADHHQPAAKLLPRRQSCSPSVSRGRKVVEVQEEATTASLKGRIQFQTGNGTQVLGSRMVQRVMNARKSVTRECHHEEKDQKKPNSRFPIRESSGFGRILHGTALPN
ncbi:PREDICTED: mucin-5AC [Prunus dulcis]|uniref:PREDICTED: mucin-5AC n=1 Tax=Prunus dulcis TaxID=3755 RepID=A0A5E4EBR5_PRUDU|nr:PREDICTED: mucin-5AC [Prunus dulcis]